MMAPDCGEEEVMDGRRRMRREEIRCLADRLRESESDEGVRLSYDYPMSDLIRFLDSGRMRHRHRVELSAGRVVRYFLFFRSPEVTWLNLCGVEGIYRVDAATLRAEDFEMTCMN